MLPLPAPQIIEPRRGVEKLRQSFCACATLVDFVIIVASLLAALAAAGHSP